MVHEIDRVREKIVEVRVELPGRVETTDRVVEKLFVEKQFQVLKDQIPCYNDNIIEVEKIREKIVPVERVIKEIV